MDIQQDYDSDGNKSKKDTFLEIIVKLEHDDKDGGDGGDSDEVGIEENDHEKGMYDEMMEREEEADHTVQIPTNHGSAGYVEYIKDAMWLIHLIANSYIFQTIGSLRRQMLL